MAPASLLEYVRQLITVDVDSMDPQVAARHTTDGVRFCDMTSNQAIVFTEAAREERAAILKAACQQAKMAGHNEVDQQIADALDILTVLLAKEVFPYLTGRVHAQTSPPMAYDTAGTVAHAQKLVALFEANGIPRSRVCIKIPATPESIVACQILEDQGIRTLATCLFSLPQAIAASQAKCLYVAPYFNELRVHFESSVWKEYEITEKQHPMAPVISSIVQTFKSIDSRTLIMPASIVTSAEVLALASLHPDHLTLSGAVLDQLASSKIGKDILQPRQPDVSPIDAAGRKDSSNHQDASTKEIKLEVDYLADGAAELRKALGADLETTRKLKDALKIFGEMEEKTKELIRKELV